MSDSSKPELTALMRARIVEGVGKRQFARTAYEQSRSEGEAHRNAMELRRATDALESADYVEALMAKVEEYEKDLDCAVFPGWRSYEEWVAAGRTVQVNENGEGN